MISCLLLFGDSAFGGFKYKTKIEHEFTPNTPRKTSRIYRSPGLPNLSSLADRFKLCHNNPDFVAVGIHSYRHLYGLVPGDPELEKTDQRLADRPQNTVPCIVFFGVGYIQDCPGMKTKYKIILEAREILELDEYATMQQIKDSFKRLIKQWHPDKNQKDVKRAEEKTKNIITAYKIIADYCVNYRFSFSKEEVEKYIDGQEWWFKRFGDDSVGKKYRK